MPAPTANHRWYHPTPARFFLGLLVVQVYLLLSERFQWFAFNEKKGWTVLIAVGVVGLAVLVMVIWFLVTLVLRRRFQFSFRSLLLFLLAVSMPLGWFAWEMQRATRQREAVEAIMEAGGVVLYDFEIDEEWMPIDGAERSELAWQRRLLGDDFFCDVKEVACDDPDFADDDAIHLRALTEVQSLDLSETQIRDHGLKHLERLTSLTQLNLFDTQVSGDGLQHLVASTDLEYLSLDGTSVTDAGLTHLKNKASLCLLGLGGTQVTDRGLKNLRGLSKLKTLYLVDTQTTDTGLMHLAGMTSLQQLCVDNSQVTDAGLEYLRELTELHLLSLGYTKVTDAGLVHLWQLPKLRVVYVNGTKVTDEGAKKLQLALPDCQIIR